MQVRAFSRDAKISPKKVRLILDEIRGKRVDEAMALLRFMPTPHARTVAKVVRSAVANAENNYSLQPRDLRVAEAYAGDGLTYRRMLPRARGRADVKRRRRTNITVIVEDQEL
jgi:large subunit ribosomal protein L22